ncbi:MAG: hypothetical protein ACRC7N_03600 [Clostridium sp.]
MKKLSISFKDNQEEQKLYNFLKDQLSPSVYIKMLLKREMCQQEMKQPAKQNNRRSFDF